MVERRQINTEIEQRGYIWQCHVPDNLECFIAPEAMNKKGVKWGGKLATTSVELPFLRHFPPCTSASQKTALYYGGEFVSETFLTLYLSMYYWRQRVHTVSARGEDNSNEGPAEWWREKLPYAMNGSRSGWAVCTNHDGGDSNG